MFANCPHCNRSTNQTTTGAWCICGWNSAQEVVTLGCANEGAPKIDIKPIGTFLVKEDIEMLRKELEGAILDKHRFADECEGLKIEVMALTEIVAFKDERLAENLAAVKKLEGELDEERTVNSAFRREIDRLKTENALAVEKLKTENEILMEELSNGESDS